MSESDITKAVHAKIIELARASGKDAHGLSPDEVIPESGLLDSAAIMELIIWYEAAYDLSIPSSELTLDNFGTIAAMVRYVEQARRG